MIFEQRVGLRELSGLCRRWATSLEAGVDLRRMLKREVSIRGSRAALGKQLDWLQSQAARGVSLADALDQTGDFFPPLFHEMVHVGEETGQLAEVLRRLADHYEHQLKLRQTFLAALTWPALQLAAAIFIVGVLIWVLGIIGSTTGSEPIDILGLGLVGNRGVAIYALIVASLLGCGYLIYQAVRRGWFWVAPLQRLVLRVPVLGHCLQTLALSRLSWSLHVTLDSGMELRKALPLALRTTGNARYERHSEQIVRRVVTGHEIVEALAETGAFPDDFLDRLDVGERAGRLPETMALLSRQYQDQAQAALATLTVLAGFAVWGLVALLIIALIFKLFMFYLGTINEALNF